MKPMSSKLRHIPLFSGNTILGDGAVVLIIDPNGIARVVGSAAGREQFATAAPLAEAAGDAAEAVTLLIFRGGGESLKAVPLSLVDAAREDRRRQDRVGRRPTADPVPRPAHAARSGRPGDRHPARGHAGRSSCSRTASARWASSSTRSSTSSTTGSRSSSSPTAPTSSARRSIRNRATEIVNVAHYLPLAHDDWARPPGARGSAGSPTVLLVDDSAFFREHADTGPEGGGLPGRRRRERRARRWRSSPSGARVDVVVTDIDMPGTNGFDLVAALRPGPALGSPAGDRAVVGADAAGGRAGAPARHRRVRGEVRPQRPRRRACRDARPDRRSRMTAATESSAPGDAADLQASEYVTVTVADQMFGLADRPRARRLHRQRADDRAARAARDRRAPQPARPRRHRASACAAGSGCPTAEGGRREMAVGLEHHGESYGLLVDEVGEVMKLSTEQPRAEPGPSGRALDRALARRAPPRATGCLIILDVDAVLAFDAEARAA